MSKIGKLSDSVVVKPFGQRVSLMGRKPVFGQNVSRPSCGSHHVVKCGRPLGRQKRLCRDCGKYFLGDATYHSRKSREEASKILYGRRAVFRLNVPLSAVFAALW